MCTTEVDCKLSTIESNFQNYIEKGPWGHWPAIRKDIEYIETPVSLITLDKLSSVLILLVEINCKVHVLLTTRSNKVTSHKGQVCFPGGQRDPSDSSSVHTALREAEEEIGLPPTSVRVLGCLERLPTAPHFLTVVVGVLTDPKFEPVVNKSEVSNFFYCPLEFFLSPEHMTTSLVDWESGGVVSRFTIYTCHYFCPVTESTHKIWGLTSNVAIFASCVAHNKLPPFDGYYHQPCSEVAVDNKISLIYYFLMFDNENNHIMFYLLSPHRTEFGRIFSRL